MTSQNCETLSGKFRKVGVFPQFPSRGILKVRIVLLLLPTKLRRLTKFRENRFRDLGESWLGIKTRHKNDKIQWSLSYIGWLKMQFLDNR